MRRLISSCIAASFSSCLRIVVDCLFAEQRVLLFNQVGLLLHNGDFRCTV